MTKKRHAKLLRAFVTRVHEISKKDGHAAAKDMYRCVRMANDGHIPEGYTREGWWQKVGKETLEIFGVGNIKEVNRKTK